ncbi:MAG: DUF2339 domain-containing protein [Dysgonomonas sp.]|nr:DUF2339 domain-containing protein [Dysgonomonas sp.]
MGTLQNRVDRLINDINNQDKKISELFKNHRSKEDTQEILDAINELKERISGIQTIDVSIPRENDKDKSSEESVIKEDIKESVAEVIESPILEEIVEEIQEQSPEELIAPDITKNTVAEGLLETDALPKEEETPPPFAAFVRPEESRPIIVETETPPPYQTPPVEVYDEPERNFLEKIMGENWLSKIGIITLVLGIAFFVKYAIDQEWINEVGRVGIGILTGGIIIGIAHKLKSKYHVFSSILVGGGISVLYITITLAFREYELFSQTIAFLLLIGVTIFSVILSLYYDRKELAIFSLLGGFASPLMISTGTGNYIVLFSYILILNSGMLVISFIKKWRVIGILCYVLTLCFFWSWVFKSFETEFIGVTIFASLFFIQFYLLALFDHFKSGNKITPYQATLILSNNLFFFLACLYVFDNYPYDVRGIVTISIAVVNALIMFTLFRKSEVDRNLIYLIIAVVMTFVSLAIPIQLQGHVITMFWAAEMVILLLLWQRSQIAIFRIGFIIISGLTIISYIIDINHNYTYDPALTIVLNRIFITGLVVMAAFGLVSFLLKKEDPDSIIEIRGVDTFSIGSIIKAFKVSLIGLSFIVPFLELNYQLERFTDIDYTSSFRYLAMATYTFLYIMILAVIYRNKFSKSIVFIQFFAAVFFYTIVYSYLAIELRFDIFYLKEYNTTYFLLHLLSLPMVAFIVYLLIKNVKSLHEDWFAPICWGLVIMSVSILSVETDHIIILLFGGTDNYSSLLYDVHTFGYPILWGVLAMILMVWGLNRKEVLLRKISLIFFGVIIVKFYAYDVWHMSQAGRIVSFVLLGVILLLVSFLQQKIKTLVKDDETEKKEDNL